MMSRNKAMTVNFDHMISVSDAITQIQNHTSLLPPVNLLLQNALGHVLAEDVFASISIPPFDQSAMDGYAFRFDDLSSTKELHVAGEVAAGGSLDASPEPFQAVRIFTGATVPAGCDTVVMQEKTEVINNRILVKDELLEKGRNVRSRGSEINAGELALKKGTILTPAAIGYLANLGINEVCVHPKPIVHIIITGSELQKPGSALLPGQVYESNSAMLQAALLQLGVTNINVHNVKDDVTEITAAIQSALQEADLILLTGGVSVGNYDLVIPAADACGVKKLFHKVAQRPGKPLFAGIKDNKIIFGLPGNPASVLTCFYVYVTKAIEKMSGREYMLQTKQLLLTSAFSKKIQLTQFLKAVCTDDDVTILQAQESFRLSSFSLANCLVVLPEEKMQFEKGDRVETILLPYL